MHIISLDLETTGLDTEKSHVLHIGAVFEDTEAKELLPIDQLPSFEAIIDIHEYTHAEPMAMVLNAPLIEAVEKHKRNSKEATNTAGFESKIKYKDREAWFYNTEEAWWRLFDWIMKISPYSDETVLAGKNISKFDYQFMPQRCRVLFHYRHLELGSAIMGSEYGDWTRKNLPGFTKFSENDHAHDALIDAQANIRVLRKITNNYGRSDF